MRSKLVLGILSAVLVWVAALFIVFNDKPREKVAAESLNNSAETTDLDEQASKVSQTPSALVMPKSIRRKAKVSHIRGSDTTNEGANRDPLEEHWTRGNPDSKWQGEIDEYLTDKLERLRINYKHRETSCRGSLCRIQLVFSDKREAKKMYKVRPPVGVGVASKVAEHGNEIEVTVFITRKGMSLSDFVGG